MKNVLWARIPVAALSVLFVASCSVGGRFADNAIDYNKTVEKAANGQILLNALRARDRTPMYFSAISQLRGSYGMTSSGSLGLTIPFGGDAFNVFPLSPSVNLAQSMNPSFDLAVLDSQEFHQGILRPIPMDLLEYYWQQRWPEEVLLHLFIHKVEETVDNQTVTIPNAPEFDADLSKFRAWLDKMEHAKLILGREKEGHGIGPQLILNEQTDLTKLIAAEAAKLSVVKVADDQNPRYRLCRVTESAKFCFGTCRTPNLPEECNKDLTVSRPSPNKDPEKGATTQTLERTVDGEKATYIIHLRSVQGVLYYLGEVLRAKERNNRPVLVKWGPKKTWVPLFDLVRTDTRSETEPPLSVEYGASHYSVPDGEGFGVTKTVISLVAQLLGLNKTTKELPTTTIVQVVGQ